MTEKLRCRKCGEIELEELEWHPNEYRCNHCHHYEVLGKPEPVMTVRQAE